MTRFYILHDELHTSFSASPPFVSSSLFMPEPTLLPKVVSELLDPLAYPFPLADVRRQPARVMENTGKAKQRNHSSQFMQQQESGDVSDRRIDQRRGILLEELWQSRAYSFDARPDFIRSVSFWI